MKKELWIPNLPYNPESDYTTQAELCSSHWGKVDLHSHSGGCIGVVCGSCMLHADNYSAYEKWADNFDSNAHDTSTNQHSLFD